MISWWLAAPAGGALLAGLAAGLVQRHLRPAFATGLLTLLIAAAATAVVMLVTLLAAMFVAQLPAAAGRLDWCLTITRGHEVPTWLGAGALISLLAMGVSLRSAMRRLPARRSAESGPLVVLPVEEPTAFAVPGRPGHVVVSKGMLRLLDGDERRVLLAHERAHLRRHHHRYNWVASVAVAVVPPLGPVRTRIRFATERWADEDAAGEVGDRRLVARTIARAALAQSELVPALALARLGVRARVDALLNDPKGRRTGQLAALAGLAFAIGGIASSTLQVHHVAALLGHFCRA
ncbi:MAG: M48 family metalloprotease [Actinomycetota bacterium]|nr:M48 family metalloprotease [Actinomycetota bacterium]